MALSKKDKQDIAEMIAQTLSAVNSANADNKQKNATLKGASSQKTLWSSKDRENVLQKLTPKERVELWGDITPDNIFSGRYSTANQLYKSRNIDGRPSLPYSQAWEYFILPICRDEKKYTKKQLSNLVNTTVKQLESKKANTPNNKSAEWLDKAITVVKGSL